MDQVKLEMLRIAKEIVMNEYTERRAQEHNKWLVESEHLWRTQKLRLAYPVIPMYPSEAEVITRADKLMEYLTTSSLNPVKPPMSEPATESTQTQVLVEHDQPLETFQDAPQGHTLQEEPVIQVAPETPNNSENPAPPVEPEESASVSSINDAEEQVLNIIAEHAKFKAEEKMIDRSTTTSRILPGVLKKIEDMRGWKPI